MDAAVFTCVVINSLSSPVAVVGNTLVVSAIWRNSSLRTPSYIFLAGLAITDFCTGLIVQPAYILYVLGRVNGNAKLSFFAITTCNIVGRYFFFSYNGNNRSHGGRKMVPSFVLNCTARLCHLWSICSFPRYTFCII